MKTITLIALLALVPLMASTPQPPKPEPPLSPESIEERIIQVLYDSGFSTRMTQIILAQAKHESGGFKNRLTVFHNNLFAMRHPYRRSTTSCGPLAKAEGREGYASFASIEDSVRDYILYYRFVSAPDTTLNYYVTFLKCKRYYESSEVLYLRSLKRWINQDKTLFENV